MMKESHGAQAASLSEWRQRIASKDGPPGYTVRLCLLALAAIMEREKCTRLKVSYRSIADATTLGKVWIGRNLVWAVRAGWLIREHGHQWVKGCSAFIYEPAVPADLSPSIAHRMFHVERRGEVNGVGAHRA